MKSAIVCWRCGLPSQALSKPGRGGLFHSASRVAWMPSIGRGHFGLGLGGIGYMMRDTTLERTVASRSKVL